MVIFIDDKFSWSSNGVVCVTLSLSQADSSSGFLDWLFLWLNIEDSTGTKLSRPCAATHLLPGIYEALSSWKENCFSYVDTPRLSILENDILVDPTRTEEFCLLWI